MAREEKGELIADLKEVGLSTKQIALIIYKDRSEEGQKKVRAMLSYMKKKGMLLKVGPESHYLNEFFELQGMFESALKDKRSFVHIIPILRKRKTLASGLLWLRRFSVAMIAVILYGDHGEENENKVYAHISKFRKRIRKYTNSGFDLHEQNLRSEVAILNFTNKSFDFSVPTQPQNLNLKSATATMEVKA
jgi:hypothetical protein